MMAVLLIAGQRKGNRRRDLLPVIHGEALDEQRRFVVEWGESNLRRFSGFDAIRSRSSEDIRAVRGREVHRLLEDDGCKTGGRRNRRARRAHESGQTDTKNERESLLIHPVLFSAVYTWASSACQSASPGKWFKESSASDPSSCRRDKTALDLKLT